MPDERDDLHEYFQDTGNCNSAIITARKAFGSTTTTEKQYDQIEKTLGIMYFHCPEDLQVVVLSTIEEAIFRRAYFEPHWQQAITS